MLVKDGLGLPMGPDETVSDIRRSLSSSSPSHYPTSFDGASIVGHSHWERDRFMGWTRWRPNQRSKEAVFKSNQKPI